MVGRGDVEHSRRESQVSEFALDAAGAETAANEFRETVTAIESQT